MDNRNTRNSASVINKSFKISIIFIIILCIAIFIFMTAYMNMQTQETVNKVSSIYMEGLNNRISMHFSTMINYCLAQVETIAVQVPAGVLPAQQEWDKLAEFAKANGFTYLSLYSSENGGEVQILYGDPIPTVTTYEPFKKALNDSENRVIVGTDEKGNKNMLLGTAAHYPMKNGKTSTAIIGGLPSSYIGDILALDEKNQYCDSYIIRRNGSFVIRNVKGYDNYFDLIAANPDDYFGSNEMEYTNKLKAAIENNENFGEVISFGDNRLQVYCTRLPHSEWFLITEMPTGSLNAAVSNLGDKWISLSLVSCAVILLALSLVFAKYYGISLHQVDELNIAKEEAMSASRAKSDFFSNMSHDIRTPMNAIVGMTTIALNHLDNKDQVKHCLENITLSSRHLLGLINDVLDMSKIESGNMTLNIEKFSLRELTEGVIRIILPQVKAKDQSFDVFTENIIAENIFCDYVRLNQVLLNLLSNAVKFTPPGGSIHMYLYEEPSPLGEGYVRVHIDVKDTGIGMSEEFLKVVFESFARENDKKVRRIEGAGLGMAITKYIVDALGGTIEVQSEKDLGSVFRVTLDLESADISDEDMVLPPLKMLIVDDDKPLCLTTAESLKEIGVEADWTLSGEEAVELVKSHNEQGDPYKIIMIDWRLPDKDGISTAHDIRKYAGSDVPLLLISAYDWAEIEDDAKNAGINGFISKPLFKSTLYYGLKPYIDQELSNLTEAASETKYNFKGKRVLVAEDNDLNWEIVDTLLSEYGFELELAKNGKECVEKFEASPTNYYDIILMDIQMPIMSGIDAASAIRSSSRPDNNIPIIAMTANAFSDDIVLCIESGMDAHIAKPINIADVLKTMNKYLN